MSAPIKKTIITVVGKDTVGIIAKVCTYLADNDVNVEDISQTIIQGFFNMMMIVDTSRSSKPFGEMAGDLERIGEEMGLKIRCQHEDIFTRMHRI
ncbi:ACT domain-containing protein [Methanovulcanius yangii]|nr:ACT domain-containing protein [Methanovulcanius yangii]